MCECQFADIRRIGHDFIRQRARLFGKRCGMRVQIDKDKVAENLDLHLIQTKILSVEIFDETRLARLQKTAIKIIAPSVIGADYALCMPVPLQQFMTAMLTHIIEGTQHTVTAANGGNALPLNMCRRKTARLDQLFLMTQKLPGPVENLAPVHIQPCRIDIGVLVKGQ